jgi:hypothetical protein
MKTVHLFLLCFILIGTGTGLFIYKYSYLGFPLTPDSVVEVWDVEAEITFEAKDKPVKVILHIPQSDHQYTVISEHFVSGRFGLTTDKDKVNRRVLWSIRKINGLRSLYYRAVVRQKNRAKPQLVSEPEVMEHQLSGPQFSAAQNILTSIFAQSADIDSMISELFKHLNKEHPDEDVFMLLGKDATTEKKVKMAARILAVSEIPARIVYGIELKEQKRSNHLIQWLEVYFNKSWRSYNPTTGLYEVPGNYLSWYRGIGSLFEVKGAKNVHLTISMSPNQEEAITAAVEQGKILSPDFMKFFSLFNLPIQTQILYRILLLIPVGAFLLVILRNVIGFKTFGTFMPVLVALAFRETQLLWGVLWFVVLIGLGLALRFYLEHLKLLLVPRLAAVLIIVVFLMVLLSVLTHNLGIERGISIALFPMVIMTMTIERMSIVWEERGAVEALQQSSGTLIAAVLSYFVITNEFIGHFVFIFPELLFVILAFTLLLGRYTGYRLFEINRFKALVKREKA